MPKFDYTPDEDVKVHGEGAIRLICKGFQSHERGLPEWLKNSADAYAREDSPESKRVIVVIFDHGHRGREPSISCLDLSGMSSTVIEKYFRVWADPEAARAGVKTTLVQGGHGNGGKCYMTQMFDEYALLHTVKRGRGNSYGVRAGSLRFGYIPDREQGRDFSTGSLREELDLALKSVGCTLGVLPEEAIIALSQADGFTLVTGVGPKGYGNRIPARRLIQNLQDHPQMVRTLELCRVYGVVRGEILDQGRCLVLPPITPMPGAETPKEMCIPETLKDPLSGEEVSTTDGGRLGLGKLVLRTSDRSMRWKRKARHNIVYRAESGYIGYVPVAELDVQSSYRDQVYGECQLEALEPFKMNERARLADSPLTRAVENHVSEQVEAYAREFERRDKRMYDQEEKNALSAMNEALDRWKNRFLTQLMEGLWGAGEGAGDPERRSLPVGKPARIELNLTHGKAGVGVSFRPTLKLFDKEGREIRAVPYRWVSEDNNIAMVDEDLMVINTFSVGETRIHAEILDGRLRSNQVPLEVVCVHEIRIVPDALEIAAGSRAGLSAVCRLENEKDTADVYLLWTENNSEVARVSSAGLVFAFAPGETEVSAGDDRCWARKNALVKVVPGEGRKPGDKRGRGYPRVLVSGGIDRDPDTQEYVNFSKEYPPVCQRPQDADRNIWWINSSAPLARLYLDRYGYDSREWRTYHLERYVEVIVQIALTHGPEEAESLSVNDWITKWGSHAAEIQSAAASDLSEFIENGVLTIS